MQNRKAINNQKRILEVGLADSINLTAIFTLFLKEVFTRFLEETARFFMFPFAAAGACIQAVLAWRQAKLENGKKGTIMRAIVETLGALAISTAVIGSFVAASIFAIAAPIIFTATMAAKTLFHAVSAIYYWGKSAGTNNKDKKQTYLAMARANVVATVAGALATVAVGLVMIAAKPIFAILGVASGLIGTIYSVYKRCTMPTLKKVESAQDIERAPLIPEHAQSTSAPTPRPGSVLTRSAQLHKQFKPTSHDEAVVDQLISAVDSNVDTAAHQVAPAANVERMVRGNRSLSF